MRESNPSVFNITGELDPRERGRVSDRFKNTASKEVGTSFSDYDFSPEEKEFQAAGEIFNEFLDEVFAKAAKREFLNLMEREVFALNLEIGFRHLYEFAKRSDTERLKNLSPGKSREELADSLLDQIVELEVSLEDDNLSEEERQAAEREMARLKGIGKTTLLRQVRGGRKSQSGLSERELAGHSESIQSFLSRKPEQGGFNPREAAEKIVDEYNRLLVAHKISLGIEAKYSDEEILEHLRGALPEAEEDQLRLALKEGRKEFDGGKPDEIGKFKMYTKIMSVLFRDKKAAALGFSAGTLVIGALAPLTPRYLGEFIRTGEGIEAMKAAVVHMASSVSQAELNLRLSNFLSERLLGGGDLAGKFSANVLEISSEGFSKTDATILQRQVARAIEQVERVAEISIKDLGADLSRVVGLGLSMVLRLGDPLLFAPVVLAAGINIALSSVVGKRVNEAQRGMFKANDELTKSLDEILQIKKTRGEAVGLQEQIKERCLEAREKYFRSLADLQRSGGLPLAIILSMNALIASWRGTDSAAVTESVIASQLLSQSLTGLVEKSVRLSAALQPVVDLANFVGEFKNEGGKSPEKWEVELTDVKRRGLTVSKLKISPGDFCVVVGDSGAGKSTLLDILTGFGVDRGIIQVDGQRWSGVDRQAYRDGLVVANQFFALETKSLRDNIVGSSYFDRIIFEESLAAFGLDKTLEKAAAAKSKKTKKEIKNPGDELVVNSEDFSPSGGERKKIAMAAIDYRLRTNPNSVKMIVLDEPTAGINNPAGSRQIFERIAAWRRDFPDKTIVISNHDSKMFDGLPEDSRILGIEAKDGVLIQDETLAGARKNFGAPFAQLFNE